MSPEMRLRLSQLVDRMQTETDQQAFTKLIYEFNVLLDEVSKELKHKRENGP